MKVRLEWTYRTPKGTATIFRSEEMPAGQAMLIAQDAERTGRVKELVFVDPFDDSIWTMKEMKSYLKGIETEAHNISVYFDGGYDLQSGRAGMGCVIYYEQNGMSYRMRRNAPAEGLDSNNEAEYAALHFCVQELEFMEVHDLPVRFAGDSQVVVNGMAGEWPILESDLSRWADRIDAKLNKLGIQPEYELLPRKENFEADRLATQALNGIEITGTSSLDD